MSTLMDKEESYMVRAVEVVEGGHLERRDFGFFGVLGMACIVTCVYTTILTTLAVGITSGGPVLLLWGLFVAAGGALLIALSLGELSSAYPSSRGPMEWAFAFTTPRYRRVVSYMTGHINWIGYSVIQAGFAVLMGQQILALVVLRTGTFVPKAWHTWIIAEASILCASLVNIFGIRIFPLLDKLSLGFFFVSFVCYLVVPLACARHNEPQLQSPSFVFGDFINMTGWTDFVAFMVGLSGLSASFGGTDAITHIAEEVVNPARIIPYTMIANVAIGFFSTFVLLIALLFAMVDVDSILTTATNVPYIQLVYNATQSFAGTACMALLVIMITFLALIGMVLTASRIAFTVARDGGFFSEKYFAYISPKLEVPVRTIMATSALSMALCCIYLGSVNALNSFLNCVMVLNWLCYGTCILALVLAGRRFKAPGPFRLGRWGWPINIATVLYMLVQGIFFLFPYGIPTTVATMNYSAVVLTGLISLVGLSWFITGRKYYLALPSHGVVGDGGMGIGGTLSEVGSEKGEQRSSVVGA